MFNILDRFVRYVNELNGTIALFGYNEIAKKLIKKFPKRFEYVVSRDVDVIGSSGMLPVISIEEFKQKPTQCVVIVDESMKFYYLYDLYKVMYRINIPLLGGRIKIRYPYSAYEPRRHDFDFVQTMNNLPMKYTIPNDSTIRLIDCIRTTGSLEGDIIELGTGYGGSTYFIADTVQRYRLKKKIYTIDRFENTSYLPALSFESTRNHLRRFPEVIIIKGNFEEELTKLTLSKISFCFCDEYATPTILEYIYPRLVKSSILLIDNYTHGCDINWGKPIADIFFENKPEKIIRVGNTQGMVIKQ